MQLSFLLGQAIAIATLAFTPAAAADLPIYGAFRTATLPTWQAEVGARFAVTTGTTKKDLFGDLFGTNLLVSRLTYRDLLAFSGEIFGRLDHASGMFLKGYGGAGAVTGGTLQDEDFPPITAPYSSTDSAQRSGSLSYLAVDLGYAFWRQPTFAVGAFIGYHHYFQRVNAYGCTQTAGNDICTPAIPTGTLGITETTRWDAFRLGLNVVWRFADQWKLTADAAWLPIAWLNATDRHWLRTDLPAPLPQHGGGINNVQLELVLNYDFTNCFSVGVGGRYWSFDTGSQGADVNFAVAGGIGQALSYRTQLWGGFLQASYRFGS
jgi:hypothetical protein